MNQTQLEQPYQSAECAQHTMEMREESIREAFADDSEKRADAVCAYYDASKTVFQCDGSDLLTEFTAALADAAHLIDAIAHGDPLPDCDLLAFRALCKQSAVAVERQNTAIDEAVFAELSQ